MIEKWCKRCDRFVQDPYHRHVDLIDIIIFVVLIVALLLVAITSVRAEVTQASYYTLASCLKEGTSGITSSGERLKDGDFTAASWDYPFGTLLRISHNGRNIVVRVNDRGPAKRLYRAGRKLDLSRRAFERLAPLSKGVIRVEVECIS